MLNYYYKIIYNINTLKAVCVCTLLLVMILKVSAQNYSDIQLANEYILKGEKKKAREIYSELSKSDVNNIIIYNNYLAVLLDLGEYDEAHAYVKKILRKEPDNLQCRLDAGLVYVHAGDLGKADKYFKEVIAENKTSVQRIKMISDYFMAKSLIDYGILALTQSRQVLGNPYLFSLDLAMLYRIQGSRDKMVTEYLSYVTQNSGNTQYVKNVMQALLTKPDELESLEKILYEKVQQQPDVEVYSDLLIWVNLQQKNFSSAFIQARAYDKRYKNDGQRTMEVARVALDNEDYYNATKIYRYVVREYPESQNYLQARLGLIHTRESRVKRSFPVKKDSVKLLIQDYKNFIKQHPENANSLEAARSEALLFAYYLDQKDSAILILSSLILDTRASMYLKSKSKLDLGDIYLLKNEPWESTLLYSQVEKTQKESPLGYEAKLKNAKLSYYRGNFRLAQEHLDILKQATTREIANDALDLSILIKENIMIDSTGEALKEYASIELLLYQNKTQEALSKINFLKQGLRTLGDTVLMSDKEQVFLYNIKFQTRRDSAAMNTITNQTILDDVYWLEANIRMKQGEFYKSIALLQKIRDEHPDDILSDDAYFLQGDIYENQLQNKEKAMEIYRDFLTVYPGSVYAAEARKRFRSLRGDFSPSETQPQF
ncbi:MAG TPA: tetratricopeptide repeat protein [Chryseolinea sp.]|nr:tetratricopeptide repeat protein [Chryseolinea sp.]